MLSMMSSSVAEGSACGSKLGRPCCSCGSGEGGLRGGTAMLAAMLAAAPLDERVVIGGGTAIGTIPVRQP
jgi:hypothetical protein